MIAHTVPFYRSLLTGPSDFSSTYESARSNGISNPVPWVADFTAPPKIDFVENGTQSPVPRPFYCTMFWEDQNEIDRFVAHDWYFYTMPDQVTVSTNSGNSSGLYVDPHWQW